IGQGMLFAGHADFAQQLEGVGVENIDHVVGGVDNVKKAVFGVEGEAAGIAQHVRAKRAFFLVPGVEDQDFAKLDVGNEDAVVIGDGQAIEEAEGGVLAVADQLHRFGFGIEDKNGRHALIGGVNVALGVHRHAVGADQLKRNLAEIDLVVGLDA